jgi:hypothetical protein
MTDNDLDFKGLTPESWHGIDCGFNTAPGCLNRIDMEKAAAALGEAWHSGADGINQRVDHQSEIYTVRERVWQAAGMQPMGGCLCIGCLEKRLGRRLKPKDFLRNDPFNQLPGTARLWQRRGRARAPR